MKKTFSTFSSLGMVNLGTELKDGNEACVYVLVDPRDDTVRYVGKTIQPKTRLNGHFWGAAGAIARWIEELRILELRPQMRIIAMCRTSGDALVEESCRIRDIGTAHLYNADWTGRPHTSSL